MRSQVDSLNTTEFRAHAQPQGSGKERAAAELLLVLLLFGASLALLPLPQIIHGGVAAHLYLLVRMAAILAICTILMRARGQRWNELGLRRPSSWRRVGLLVIGGYFGFGLLQLLLVFALRTFGLETANNMAAFAPMKGNAVEYLFFLLPVSWGAAAFGEEMFARGFLLDRLSTIFGRETYVGWWLAAIAQAVLFGSAHSYQGPAGVVLTGCVGLVFGVIFLLARRNLWPCIILHGVTDSVAMTAVFLGVAPGV